MRLTSRLSIAVLLFAGLVVCPACSKPAAEKTGTSLDASGTVLPEAGNTNDRLTIAIAGMVTPKSGLQYYKDLSEYVGRKVGEPVRLVHKADYSQVNEMLRDHRVDVAFVCSGPYVAGHDAFGVTLLAAPFVNGRQAYCSYIIVAKSDPATSLASLKGRVFAFADPESNTGYIVPNYMLSQMGTTSERFFGETFLTYGHDNSIKAVAEGKADGAAVDSLIWDFQDRTDGVYTSKTRIAQKSEAFAIPPVVARPGLDPELFEKIRAVFLGADEDPEGKAILDAMQVEKFDVIDDAAYDSIRDMNERIAN